MTDSLINHILNHPPSSTHRISFARLHGTESLSLRELYEKAERVAAQLAERGVSPGDRIGICGANSLEWVLLDLAALRLKAVSAGFEPSKFSDDPDLLTRYELRLLFSDRPMDTPGARPMSEVRDWAEQRSGQLPPVSYTPDEVTTLKFTSGSTGTPKALSASVGSIDSSMNAVQAMFAHGDGDNIFVFLPLSLLQQRYWVYSALRFGHDITISTYEAAFATLGPARPTVVMGVPGFFESAKRHIELRARRADPRADPAEARRAAAVRLFGDRIRYLWTGSAPANPDTLRFFTEHGLPIYEGYGLNETCIVSKNYPGNSREGSVGRVLPGKQVLFDADGVLSVRSDHPVSRQYTYAAPGDSERVFAADGTVRTGDVGYVDDDGFLFIRGRADDVIVLENGKKVIVRPIEEHLKTSPAIEEAVIFCPAETYLVAVVSPAQEPGDAAAIEEQVARTNAAFTRDEQIARVVIARERFSISNDLLTSQFKPRRRQIFEAYRLEIIGLQEGQHA